MSEHRYRPEVEILSVTDTGRRRRWTEAEKVRIVEESFGPRGSVAETARRHDIGRTLLVRWRRQYRNAVLMGGSSARVTFMPVKVAHSEAPTPVPKAVAGAGDRVEVTLISGRRLSIAASIDPAALARLVQVLDPS